MGTPRTPTRINKPAIGIDALNTIFRAKIEKAGDQHWYKVTVPKATSFVLYLFLSENNSTGAELLIDRFSDGATPILLGAVNQNPGSGSSVAHGRSTVSQILKTGAADETFQVRIIDVDNDQATDTEYDFGVIVIGTSAITGV